MEKSIENSNLRIKWCYAWPAQNFNFKLNNNRTAFKFNMYFVLYLCVLFNVYSCNVVFSRHQNDQNTLVNSNLNENSVLGQISNDNVDGDLTDNNLYTLHHLLKEYLTNRDANLKQRLQSSSSSSTSDVLLNSLDASKDIDDNFHSGPYYAKRNQPSSSSSSLAYNQDYETFLKNIKNIRNKKQLYQQIKSLQTRLKQLKGQISDKSELERYRDLQRIIFSFGRKR